MEHTISGLLAKRREIAGQVRDHIDAARRLNAEIEHLDACLKLFGHEGEEQVAPNPYNKTFQRGELQRLVIRALRDGPADAETLSERVLEALGWSCDSATARDTLQRVRGVLHRLRKRKVVERKGDRWTCA